MQVLPIAQVLSRSPPESRAKLPKAPVPAASVARSAPSSAAGRPWGGLEELEVFGLSAAEPISLLFSPGGAQRRTANILGA